MNNGRFSTLLLVESIETPSHHGRESLAVATFARQHFGEEQDRFAMYHNGDANLDLKTDFQDFLLLASNFGTSNAEVVGAVPEPSALVLCSACLGCYG